jgi:hypothetical protein
VDVFDYVVDLLQGGDELEQHVLVLFVASRVREPVLANKAVKSSFFFTAPRHAFYWE